VRKSAILLALLLFLSVVLVSLPQNRIVKSESEMIVVPDDYESIQEAIEKADEGDMIFVKKGIYDGPINETLIINKTVSLIGEGSSLLGEETTTLNLHPLLLNKTIYYAPHFPTHALFYDTSLIVESNNVTISGFTIKVPSPGGDIYVMGDGTQITDCLINTEVLWLEGSYSTISETYLNIKNLKVDGSSQTINHSRFFTTQISSSHNNITQNTLDTLFLYDSYNIISGNSFNEMYLEYSNSNIIRNNTCSLMWIGRYNHNCSNNIFAGNILNGGQLWGILMAAGSKNVFCGNYITNYGGSHGGYGVAIGSTHNTAENNTFYHNTFVNNNENVGYNWDLEGLGNFWDNGIEGNYWDDYNGTDANGDGIGDTPYIIDENNQDNFPLMAPIRGFFAGTWDIKDFTVDICSNSVISSFSFDPEEGALIRFNGEGGTGTIGFCRVTVPKDLLDAENNWIVLVDNNPVPFTVNEDEDNTYIYFNYNHSSSKTVEIIGTDAIPESPSWTILPLLITLTLTTIFYKKRLTKKHQATNRTRSY